MIRRTIICLVFMLLASSLFAAARVAKSAAAPIEAVNWTAGVSYSFDGSGNIRQIGSDRFAYDGVGRLAHADINAVSRTYQYDAFGNRLGCTHMQGTASQTDCQLGIGIDSASNRVAGIQHDGRGNVKSFTGHTYSYDDVDMPKRDDGVAVSREFIYTADDERIATYTVGGEWTWTLRDVAGKVLREFTSNNSGTEWTWKKDYVYRDGLLLASRHVARNADVTYHYHLDHLGTPRRVTDQNNRTVGFHDYFAFGPEVSGGLTEPAATSLQYTGHERDQAGSAGSLDVLDYMHARYYSPHLGRFLTRDPGATADLHAPQSWNLYSYVGNDPIGHFDPDGNNKAIYWVISKSKHYWRQVERKVAKRELKRSTEKNAHNVQVEGPGSSGKAQSLAEETFPGQQTMRHDAHPGGPSNPMDKHKPHHQLRKQRKQGGGQVNYAEIIKGVVAFIPYIGWAVDADAATTSDARPDVEQRAQDIYGASFYDLNAEERRDVWKSLQEDQKQREQVGPPCPKKIDNFPVPCQ